MLETICSPSGVSDACEIVRSPKLLQIRYLRVSPSHRTNHLLGTGVLCSVAAVLAFLIEPWIVRASLLIAAALWCRLRLRQLGCREELNLTPFNFRVTHYYEDDCLFRVSSYPKWITDIKYRPGAVGTDGYISFEIRGRKLSFASGINEKDAAEVLSALGDSGMVSVSRLVVPAVVPA